MSFGAMPSITSDMAYPTREESQKIWDTIPSYYTNGDMYFEPAGKELLMKKGEKRGWEKLSGDTSDVLSGFVECSQKVPHVQALFLQAFYAKNGYIPDMPRNFDVSSDDKIKALGSAFYDFQEELLDYMCKRVYLSGNASRTADEIKPNIVGYSDPNIPVYTCFTRMGDTAGDFPGVIECIDIVGAVIKHMSPESESTGANTLAKVGRLQMAFPMIYLPRSNIGLGPLGISYVAPDVSLSKLRRGMLGLPSPAETALVVDSAIKYWKNRKNWNCVVVTYFSPDQGAVYDIAVPGKYECDYTGTLYPLSYEDCSEGALEAELIFRGQTLEDLSLPTEPLQGRLSTLDGGDNPSMFGINLSASLKKKRAFLSSPENIDEVLGSSRADFLKIKLNDLPGYKVALCVREDCIDPFGRDYNQATDDPVVPVGIFDSVPGTSVFGVKSCTRMMVGFLNINKLVKRSGRSFYFNTANYSSDIA